MLLSNDPADRDRARAVVAGAATNNNAWHLTAPAKEAEGSRRVMQTALATAGLTADDVDFVCAHATGTSANDVTEAAAVNHVLDGRQAPVAAFKANLGHMLGAAGLAEIVLSVEALQDGALPPVINLEQQEPECRVDVVRDGARRLELKTALTNSAGIGGNNAATVLTRADGAAGAPAPTAREVRFAGAGWVLPAGIGSGTAWPAVDAAGDALAEFRPKDYLESVKGYLDPAAGYALAAAALALQQQPPADPARTAVIGVTQYGAPASAWKFYELMVTKGHRFASPMVFPHTYSNTASNLVAIEFHCSGPHLVFDCAPDGAEAWWAAQDLVRTSAADDVLVLFFEGVPDGMVPAGVDVVNGAVCLRLSAVAGEIELPAVPACPGNRRGVLAPLPQDG